MIIDHATLVWIGFFSLIAVLLALDLGVFHRKSHEIKMKEAIGWTIVWIAVGLSFSIVVFFLYPEVKPDAASPFNPENPENYDRMEAVAAYITAYILEKMLSVDNLFIFVILFSFFGVKSKDQHHVLFWGILGALVMRGLFIFIGTEAIERYEPVLYFFGALLIYTAIKMARMGESEFKPEDSRMYKFLLRILPLSEKPHDGKFFTKDGGRTLGTCLLLCLLMVEMTDVLFAIDSVPAVIGVARDRFIIYTSNVFAILGLRALYFVIAGGIKSFKYLKPALVIILGFIGIKMVLNGPAIEWGGALYYPPWYNLFHIDILTSLGIVIGILAVAIVASVMGTREEEREHMKHHHRKSPKKDGGGDGSQIETGKDKADETSEGCGCPHDEDAPACRAEESKKG